MKRGDKVFLNDPNDALHGEQLTVNDVAETQAHVTCNRWPRWFCWLPFCNLSETPPTEPGKHENLIDKRR